MPQGALPADPAACLQPAAASRGCVAEGRMLAALGSAGLSGGLPARSPPSSPTAGGLGGARTSQHVPRARTALPRPCRLHGVHAFGGEGGRTVPPELGNYHRSLVEAPFRTTMKPLDIVQVWGLGGGGGGRGRAARERGRQAGCTAE